MCSVWWKAENMDIMISSIFQEPSGKIWGVSINNKEPRATICHLTCLRIKIILNPQNSNLACHITLWRSMYTATKFIKLLHPTTFVDTHIAFRGLGQPSLPLKSIAWKITVGRNTLPSAEMSGIRVADSLTSFLNTICLACPAEPIWQLLCVLLSRKQHVSSMLKMQSCSMP